MWSNPGRTEIIEVLEKRMLHVHVGHSANTDSMNISACSIIEHRALSIGYLPFGTPITKRPMGPRCSWDRSHGAPVQSVVDFEKVDNVTVVSIMPRSLAEIAGSALL